MQTLFSLILISLNAHAAPIDTLRQDCHQKNDKRACYQLEKAEKQAQNIEKAKPIYQKMCDSGEMNGCILLGVLAQGEGKNEEARTLFKKACDVGEDNACKLLEFHNKKHPK